MARRLEQQKQEKRESLLDAAYELFLKQGFHKTSIDEIVKKANVAKGTFYLYFKDKTDVIEEIALRLSCRLLCAAYQHTRTNNQGDFVENFIAVVDYIVEYFKHNRQLLKIIRRDLSWPLVYGKLPSSECAQMEQILEHFYHHPYLQGYSQEEIQKLLFVIVELCGSICYTSIIEGQPDDIDALKPFLYDVIRKILRR